MSTENQHESFSETQLSNIEQCGLHGRERRERKEEEKKPSLSWLRLFREECPFTFLLTFIYVVKSETTAGECGAARPFQTRNSDCRSDRCSGKDTKTGIK